MANIYTPFFAAYANSVKKGNTFTKQEMVKNFTEGRTESLKDLSIAELQELTRSLQRLAPGPPLADGGKADRMRKAIIAIFKSRDKTVADAQAWAEKQGVRGVKKPFNDYTTGELFVLIAIAEKIKADFDKGIRKRFFELENKEQ